MKERTKNLPSEKSSQLVCFRYRCTYRCAEELISWGYDVATSNYLCAIYKYDFLHEPKYENGWELLYGIRVNRNVDLSHLLWITKQNFIMKDIYSRICMHTPHGKTSDNPCMMKEKSLVYLVASYSFMPN